MAPARPARRPRRPSHKAPVHFSDDVRPLLPLLDVDPPCPSSPPAIPAPTHLPFAPGSSHTRNRKEGHIPRPPNAFMIFRSWLWNKDSLRRIERDNRNVSRIAGRYWNELSEAERAPFRCMADEAKARHAQLYPEYRYSPASQKRPKPSQRRSQRAADAENEKCKKVADLLLGGLSSPLEEHVTVKSEPAPSPPLAPDMPSRLQAPLPKRPDPPLQLTTAPKPFPVPPAYYPPILPVAEQWSETARAPACTPQIAYPTDCVEHFIATDDIPHLSLDGANDVKARDVPSHMKPGAHTVFSGVKPEAASFADACMFGAYTADVFVLPAPAPFADFDIEPYPSLVPLGSPVFTNPFDPSTPTTANHAAFFGTLDQLFGQSISPLTP